MSRKKRLNESGGEHADDLLPLAQLAKRLPTVRGKRPPNRSTLYRWSTVGLKSRSGQRVRLEVQFIGKTICSSVAAVLRLGQAIDDVEYRPSAYCSKFEERDMIKRANAARARLREKGYLRPPAE